MTPVNTFLVKTTIMDDEAMRARNIKPGFFKNEDLAEIPFAGRILFIGLWCLADRDGRLEDRPKRIRVEVFPFDNVDVDGLLSDLQELHLILRYQVAGVSYIWVPMFLKHQHPHPNEAASVIPLPEDLPPWCEALHTMVCTTQADSLNPDSLIPSSLNPKESIGGLFEPPAPTPKIPRKRKAKEPGDPRVQPLLAFWIQTVAEADLSAPTQSEKARLGKLIKEQVAVTADDEVIRDAIDRIVNEGKGEYLLPRIVQDVERGVGGNAGNSPKRRIREMIREWGEDDAHSQAIVNGWEKEWEEVRGERSVSLA